MRWYTAMVAAVVVGGCARFGGGGPAVPPALRYEVPVDPVASFVQADTALLQVDAGGETVDVTVASRATLDMTFAALAGGLMEVRAFYRDFDATASNPIGLPETSSEDEISGPLIFTLTPTGSGSLIQAPELSGGAATFVQPDITVASFFPRLPGQAVQVGDRWTDTTRVVSDQEGSRVSITAVTIYRATADTVVGGSPMLLIGIEGTDRREVEASQGGMEMTQELSGSRQGFVLWDPVRRLPVEISYTMVHSGTMEVSAAPFPLAVRVESSSRTVLERRPNP